MASIKAAIWDFNGTIDNSEHIRKRSIETTLADMDIFFRDSFYPQVMRRVGFVAAAEYIGSIYDSVDTQAFLKASEVKFWEIFNKEAALLPGVLSTLELMRSRGMKLGIASSSFKDFVSYSSEKLGISNMFDAIVTRDDIKGPGKPDPEVFHEAALRLGVPAESCVVVGDSGNDVEGALEAGMKAIFVPGWYERRRYWRNGVVTLRGLDEFDWRVISYLEGQAVSRERAF